MGDLFPWLSDHTIRVLSMIGSLGTPLAVAVTVHLALRSERLRLRIRVGWQTDHAGVGPLAPSSTRHYIMFSIANVSLRAVTIQEVSWIHRNWLGKVKGAFGLPSWDPELPLRLEPGEHCTIRFLWNLQLKSITTDETFRGSRFRGAVIRTPLGSKAVRFDRRLRENFRSAEPVLGR